MVNGTIQQKNIKAVKTNASIVVEYNYNSLVILDALQI